MPGGSTATAARGQDDTAVNAPLGCSAEGATAITATDCAAGRIPDPLVSPTCGNSGTAALAQKTYLIRLTSRILAH
jgi:hypothetical protein